MPPWIRRALTRALTALSTRWKRLWPLRIGSHIALMLVLAAGLTVLLARLFGIQLPTAADQAEKPFEGLKLVLAIVAGVGGVVALTVAYRKQKLGESTERRLEAADLHAQALGDSNESREQSRHFHERFAAATEQLGSAQANIRSAGAYALAHLADDWDEGRQTCINVLCSYIRMPYTPPEELPHDASPEDIERNELRQQQRQVRHTILDIIGERLRADHEIDKSWHDHDFDFTGATIDGGNLMFAQFMGGIFNFSEAKFTGEGISFYMAKIFAGSINFYRAKFTAGKVQFVGAEFPGGVVQFAGAEFTGGETTFVGAQFNGGILSFSGAKVNGGDVNFTAAKFNAGDINFGSTRFNGGNVHFNRADFARGIVDFAAAEFAGGIVDFTAAKFIGGDVDLASPVKWSCPPVFDDFNGDVPAGLYLPKNENPGAA